MKYKLIVICMYCNKFIREHDVKRKKEAGTSHGICEECKSKFDEEIERLKNDFRR